MSAPRSHTRHALRKRTRLTMVGVERLSSLHAETGLPIDVIIDACIRVSTKEDILELVMQDAEVIAAWRRMRGA